MNKERLAILAKFLQTKFPSDWVEKNKFNLGTWMRPSKFSTDNCFTKVNCLGPKFGTTVVEPNYCKTTGCAMGWATTIPEFKAAGLGLYISPVHIDPGIFFEGLDGIFAIIKFFDIKEKTACLLFFFSYYDHDKRNDPKYVVERLNYLLEHGETALDNKF